MERRPTLHAMLHAQTNQARLILDLDLHCHCHFQFGFVEIWRIDLSNPIFVGMESWIDGTLLL